MIKAEQSDGINIKLVEHLMEEQKSLLKLIATGRPLEECLSALCRSVPRLNPGVRASILPADSQNPSSPRPIAPDLQSLFGHEFTNAPIDELTAGMLAEPIHHGTSIISEDIKHDERWPKHWRDLCIKHNVLACYLAPVTGPDGKPKASFMLCFDEAREPNEREQQLAEFGSDIARIAFERDQEQEELRKLNESLEKRVEERTSALLSYQKQLRALASQLSKAEERERRRLGTELHDNLGQILAVAKMNLGVQKDQELDEVKDLLDKAITYTRELMSDLKPPPSLNKEDLEALVDWVAKKMERYDLDVAIEDDGRYKPLSEETQTILMECVRELLFNVVKHAEVKQARVGLSRIDKQVQITIADEGKGFNIEETEQASTTKDGGQFGLFNIGERVDLLDGKIEIKSEPGKGTKIFLFAPLKEEQTGEAQTGEAQTGEAQTGEASNKKISILLVDDHEMVRKGLRKIIEEQDDLMVIGEASDGKEAIKSAHETFPDVIVMDINMPVMGGIQATQEIKLDQPNVHIIGLSLHNQKEVMQDMLSAGASAYLTKSDAFEALCATIRTEAAVAKE